MSRLLKSLMCNGYHNGCDTLACVCRGDDIDELQMKLTNQWTLVKNDKLRQIKLMHVLEDGKQYRFFKATMVMKDVKPETLVRFY